MRHKREFLTLMMIGFEMRVYWDHAERRLCGVPKQTPRQPIQKKKFNNSIWTSVRPPVSPPVREWLWHIHTENARSSQNSVFNRLNKSYGWCDFRFVAEWVLGTFFELLDSGKKRCWLKNVKIFEALYFSALFENLWGNVYQNQWFFCHSEFFVAFNFVGKSKKEIVQASRMWWECIMYTFLT